MCKAVKLKHKEELLSVAEEIAFAKALAANDKTLRSRALKKLKKWFLIKSNQDSKGIKFTEEGFMRIWKGLFYCVWMSDKPLIQEECVESISNLVHCFSDIEDARKFVRCFFQSISQAWFGLDGHRMDKYLMLVRRFLRQILEYLNNLAWEEEKVQFLCSDFNQSLQMAPIGLNLHFTEIYLEELAKVGRGELEPRTILQMIKPFADYMAISTDTRLLRYINNFIFLHLLRQSDEGIKYGAKFEIWKEMGFPEGDIDVIQETSEDEEDVLAMDEDGSDDYVTDDMPIDAPGGPLDPRAGNVDVMLPPLDFDPVSIKEYLTSLTRKKETTTKARNAISFISKNFTRGNLIQIKELRDKHLYNYPENSGLQCKDGPPERYEKFIEGKYPLGIHKVDVPEIVDHDQIIEDKAQQLIDEDKSFVMEKQLYKKGKIIDPSDSWEITAVENIDLNITDDEFSNSGNWEVEKSNKRKSEFIEPVSSTMKKVKVTLDESLLNLSVSENDVESRLPSLSVEGENFETMEITVPSIQQQATRKNKNMLKRKRGAISFGPLPKLMNKGSSKKLLLETMKNLHEMMEKKKQERRKKIEQADKDWGLTNDWNNEDKEEEIVIPFTPGKQKKKIEISTPINDEEIIQNRSLSSGKKVEFILSRNTAQGINEYKKALRLSPNLPFGFGREPLQGVLKSAPVGSPINPFYEPDC